jgi:hypothetical protein
LELIIKKYTDFSISKNNLLPLLWEKYGASMPETVILVFSSRKLVCTGAKNEQEAYKSVNNWHSLLEEKSLMAYD